jgi:hypothetical protein
MSDHCKYCGQIEAAHGSCPCPSLPAREYWQRRGRKPLPATVRFTAKLPPCQPEPPDYSAEERRGFCLEAEPGFAFQNGYERRIP